MATTVFQACRVIIYVVAVLFLLVAVVMMAAALFNPDWQSVDAFQLHQYHLHGLYEDCVYKYPYNNYRVGASYGTGMFDRSGVGWDKFTCLYKEYLKQDYEIRPEQEHKPDRWRLTVLIFVVLTILLGLLALFFSCCGCINACAAATYAVLTFAANISGIVAVVIFAVNHNFAENRFILPQGTETYAAVLGIGFILAAVADGIFFIATMLGCLAAVLSCRAAPKSPPSYQRHQQRDLRSMIYTTPRISPQHQYPKLTSV